MIVPKMDVNFINPFIDGAIETLKVQCFFNARAGTPFLKGKGPQIIIDIAAVIGIMSPVFTGSVAVCFPQKIFLSLMGNMLGEKYTEITQELEDGASELLNIIFGQAKKVLNEKGYQIEKAIPTVIRGNTINIKTKSSRPTVVLPFNTELGIFHIEITTELEKEL